MTPSNSDLDLSEQLRLEQRAAWLRGERPLVETYLEKHPHLAQDADGLLDLIYNEYCLREECGSEPTFDDFQRRFPQYVERLRPLLVLHQAMKSAAPETRLDSPPESKFDRAIANARLADPQTETPAAGTSDSKTGRLEVRCPSCHVPMEVAVDTALTDLTCSACGSHFSLVDQSKATRMAPSLSKMGRFELIERLGVGGFGSVWKARDKELDRTVAIKIPRPGGMTGEEQEKFFREARAAAQLKHPSIVSVHEVGRDGDSIFIVSDFVRGVTLGDWLTGQQLTSREAAALCTKIADALHHAHDSGVVHRDLKPANIMIDGDGQPHLMDFGLARREVGEVTVTIDGQVLGTPAYMSSEQAQGESHTADRRSDVYSLGVILFQLLTGELPFRGNARMIMHQVINDESPSPRKLNANISKDLETITLKCLEKSPVRRYQSAQELADELGRFSAGEPIYARPISRAERAIRWVRRNKAVTALAAAVVVALVTGIIASNYFAIDARRQAAAADASRRDAVERQKDAEARKAEAEAERASAEAAVTFFTEDVLGNPTNLLLSHQSFRDTFVNMLEPAAATVDQRFKDKPRFEAEVRLALSMAYKFCDRPDLALLQSERSLALYRKMLGEDHADTLATLNHYALLLYALGRVREAEPLLKQAHLQFRKLGAEHPMTIVWLRASAMQLQSLGRAHEAEPLFKQVLEQQRKVLGEDHSETITSLNNYANALASLGRAKDAEPLIKQALEQRRTMLGGDHPDTITSLHDYAYVLYSLGRPQEAEPLIKQALEQCRKVLGEEHLETITTLKNYASALNSQGRAQEAEPLFKQALEQYRKVLGEDHPQTIMTLKNYASALNSQGRAQEAEPLFKLALEKCRKVLGEDHPATIKTLNNYASALNSQGRAREAEPLFEQALEKCRSVLGEDHSETITTLHHYAAMLQLLGRAREAEPLFKQVLERNRRVLGEDDPQSITSLSNYASVLQALGQAQDAEPLYKQALRQRRKVLGGDDPDTITSLYEYANVLLLIGRAREAEPLSRQALDQSSNVLGQDHSATITSLNIYADVLVELGRAQEAEPLSKQALEKSRKLLGDHHRDTTTSLQYYAKVLESLGRAKEAEPLFKQVLEQRRKMLGRDHPDTIRSLHDYANVLASLGRAKEAEPLYKQALEQRRKVLGNDHPDTLSCMNHLAWMLATSSIDELRNGRRAVELATSACELSKYKDPDYIETLAAAYAETGDFESAVNWSEKSIELLDESGDPALRERFSQALAKYKDKKPMRQEPAPPKDDAAPREPPTGAQPPAASSNDSTASKKVAV